jgi:aminoglycoside phosphotransferase (APT) family kinase protein
MHEGQVDIDDDLVRRLLREQFDEIAHLPIEPVASTGTVNALFRIGEEFVARLPLLAEWNESIEREWSWLPWLSARVGSLDMPDPVFKGMPSNEYPFVWSVHRWIEGAPYDDVNVRDERLAAKTLAGFVQELRSLDVVDGAPRGGRDPLPDVDEETRAAIVASGDRVDSTAALEVWNDAVDVAAWNRDSVWIHGDLLRPNLLVNDGRLAAVIDFGGVGVGDPATDLIPAWSVFGPAGRETYRAALDVDERMWRRGRGIALSQAAFAIPYYPETNPAFVALSVRAVEQIIADYDG